MDIYCYSYVEDTPSAEVARKLVATRNAAAAYSLLFVDGFPAVTGGQGALKKKCPKFLNMAKGGLYTFSLADLDTCVCAEALIRQWFALYKGENIALPKQVIFRVAIREIESWIMADRDAWSDYIGIARGNFSTKPDALPDPKQYLLSVIRGKGHRKYHRQMLPAGTASIGPLYNTVLCKFVRERWSSVRASEYSPSLSRAIMALNRI